MSHPFADTLERLRIALHDCKRYEHASPRRVPTLLVRLDDLEALLRDHARLDAEARLLYPPHVERARKALRDLYDAMAPFDGPMRELHREQAKRILPRKNESRD